jgi:hypothetical protein
MISRPYHVLTENVFPSENSLGSFLSHVFDRDDLPRKNKEHLRNKFARKLHLPV